MHEGFGFEDKIGILFGNAFIYADTATDGKDIMICPTKRYTFTLYGFGDA